VITVHGDYIDLSTESTQY